MATDAERFTSKFRKERIEARRERTERRNKAFDQRDSGEPSTGRSTIEISVQRSSTRPTTKVDVGRSELESVTSRISRLKVNEDNDGGGESTAHHHEDVQHDDDDDEEKRHLAMKKERGAGATTSKKRQQKKNLREKRRSTGVVIMPNMQPDKEEAGAVKDNTHQNEMMNASETQGTGKSRAKGDEMDNVDKETLIQQLEAYQQAIQEWKEEFDKSQKDIESLRNENYRLREENSALLKVVNQMSSGTRK